MSATREAALTDRGLRWRGLAWLALCGPWFFIAYGFCNWFTAQRAHVGTWYWEWEKHVPFVPELIVPYWSLDLLFIGAFAARAARRWMAVVRLARNRARTHGTCVRHRKSALAAKMFRRPDTRRRVDPAACHPHLTPVADALAAPPARMA